jgi:ubiquinone/menaquinone biosynthesis C-methylase UbiE
MIKAGIEVVKKNGINYLSKNGKKIKYKPWLGDLVSFLYDFIMVRSIFPKKFEASIIKHEQFLKGVLSTIHNNDVFELATGSGNLSEILPCDNRYTGIDISEGLLKIAYRKFTKAKFEIFKLFLCRAEELPFQDNQYDICICNLSLNFFTDIEYVLTEIKRVLKDRGTFICSIPVPERNQKQSVIHGKLYSEYELEEMLAKHNFYFASYDFTNGALLYFKAVLKE